MGHGCHDCGSPNSCECERIVEYKKEKPYDDAHYIVTFNEKGVNTWMFITCLQKAIEYAKALTESEEVKNIFICKPIFSIQKISSYDISQVDRKITFK